MSTLDILFRKLKEHFLRSFFFSHFSQEAMASKECLQCSSIVTMIMVSVTCFLGNNIPCGVGWLLGACGNCICVLYQDEAPPASSSSRITVITTQPNVLRSASLPKPVRTFELNAECPICLDDASATLKETILEVHCGHRFHASCLEAWSKAQRQPPLSCATPTCPVCREPFMHAAS